MVVWPKRSKEGTFLGRDFVSFPFFVTFSKDHLIHLSEYKLFSPVVAKY